MSNQQVNHLANRVEKLAKAGTQLNHTGIANRLTDLQKLNAEVKALLANTLTEPLLENLWIVSQTTTSMTVVVNSHTMRNHLQRMHQSIMQVINQSPKYDLTEIRFKYVSIPMNY